MQKLFSLIIVAVLTASAGSAFGAQNFPKRLQGGWAESAGACLQLAAPNLPAPTMDWIVIQGSLLRGRDFNANFSSSSGHRRAEAIDTANTSIVYNLRLQSNATLNVRIAEAETSIDLIPCRWITSVKPR